MEGPAEVHLLSVSVSVCLSPPLSSRSPVPSPCCMEQDAISGPNCHMSHVVPVGRSPPGWLPQPSSSSLVRYLGPVTRACGAGHKPTEPSTQGERRGLGTLSRALS